MADDTTKPAATPLSSAPGTASLDDVLASLQQQVSQEAPATAPIDTTMTSPALPELSPTPVAPPDTSTVVQPPENTVATVPSPVIDSQPAIIESAPSVATAPEIPITEKTPAPFAVEENHIDPSLHPPKAQPTIETSTNLSEHPAVAEEVLSQQKLSQPTNSGNSSPASGTPAPKKNGLFGFSFNPKFAVAGLVALFLIVGSVAAYVSIFQPFGSLDTRRHACTWITTGCGSGCSDNKDLFNPACVNGGGGVPNSTPPPGSNQGNCSNGWAKGTIGCIGSEQYSCTKNPDLLKIGCCPGSAGNSCRGGGGTPTPGGGGVDASVCFASSPSSVGCYSGSSGKKIGDACAITGGGTCVKGQLQSNGQWACACKPNTPSTCFGTCDGGGSGSYPVGTVCKGEDTKCYECKTGGFVLASTTSCGASATVAPTPVPTANPNIGQHCVNEEVVCQCTAGQVCHPNPSAATYNVRSGVYCYVGGTTFTCSTGTSTPGVDPSAQDGKTCVPSSGNRGACGVGCAANQQLTCSGSGSGTSAVYVYRCTKTDACATQPVISGGSCAGKTRISAGEPSNGSFVGCSGALNCFCPGLITVGTSYPANSTANVSCIPDVGNDSCGAPGRATPLPTSSPTIPPSTTPPTTPPTSTPVPQCGSTCSGTAHCPSGLVCSGGKCRNSACTASTTCVCTTTSPTPTPTVPPLACLRITSDTPTPQLGSQVRFTCGLVTGVDRYEFRYKYTFEGGSDIGGTLSATNNISEPLNISQAATYKVQCRPCVGNNCVDWEAW